MSNVLSIKDSIKTDMKNMLVEGEVGSVTKNAGKGASAIALASSTLMPVFAKGRSTGGANKFFQTLSDKMQDVYSALSPYVHVFAIVLVSIALLVRLFSKNPRSIEEANGWIKNIVITWGLFNMLSILIDFMSEFKTDNFNEPWKGF